MIARQSHCDVQQLAEMLHETLDGHQQSAVTLHLDDCSYCRQQLERLTADEGWWDDTRRTLRDLQSDRSTPFPSHSGTKTQLPSQPASRDAHTHWVFGLLQPSQDPAAMGELDGLAIQSVVGQGGMGVVLKARDNSLQRFLAVKLLSPMLAGSGAARQRFFREARAAAAVVHPNIVPIYAVSADRALPYLIMPYVAGGNLQHMLDAEGPLPLQRSLSIGLQVAEGLAAAHRQGIVHRDIKPANLMLDEGGFRILITDFGLARALDDATLTGSGLLAGTPQYMSPEQARGSELDHRSDIYSLGAVLYALATGRPPVRGESTLELLRRIGEEAPKSIVEINETYPLWYERLVQRLMAPKADARPQTAEQVAELLRAALAHARAPLQVPLPAELRPEAPQRPLWIAAATVVGVLAIGAIANSSLNYTTSEATHPSIDRRSHDSTSPPSGLPDTAAINQFAVPASPELWSAEQVDRLLLNSEQDLQRLRATLEADP